MTLAVVHTAMEAFVTGRLPLREAAAAMSLDPVSARRLAIYRNSYLRYVAGGVDSVFPATRAVVVHRCGESTWLDLVATFSDRAELEDNFVAVAAFVAFLDAPPRPEVLLAALPAWLSELADLELSQSLVYFAADEAERMDLHVAGPRRLRGYGFDVLSVKRASDPAAASPEERPAITAIWRDRADRVRTESLGPTALRILQAVQLGGERGLAELAASSGLSPEKVQTATAHLLKLGILRGAPTFGGGL